MKGFFKKIGIMNSLDGIALGLCTFNFFTWISLLSFKYYHFGYYDWDLALYAQVMWSLTQGSAHTSLFGMNFLANHSQYIAFFLVPIYFIFKHPMTLVVLKVLSYCVGGFVLYLIAKKSLKEIWAILFMILYLCYPANIFTLIYEFHFETLAIGLLFLLFYFYQEKRFTPFCITMFFVGMIKENLLLIIVAFGIYAVFFRKEQKLRWSLVPLIFGLIIFYISLFVVMPALREQLPQANAYLGLYRELGDSPKTIAQTMLFSPAKILGKVFASRNVFYIQDLFGPLFLTAFLSPHILFLASPVLLQHMLSAAFQEHTIYYHYAATIVPFIFLASINSLRLIKEKLSSLTYHTVLIVTMILCVLNSLSYGHVFKDRIAQWNDPFDSVRWDMVKKVPRDRSLVATLSFLGELSQRENIFSLHTVWQGANVFTGKKPYPSPEQVDYALIDFDDPWLIHAWSAKPQKTAENIGAFFSKNDWRVVDAFENIVLLKKDGQQKDKLLEKASKPLASIDDSKVLSVDENFELISFNLGKSIVKDKHFLPLTFSWKCNRPINAHYIMILVIKKDNQPIWARQRRVGYAYYPTIAWEEGDYIKENYWMLLPPNIKPGIYSVETAFLKFGQKKWASLLTADSKRVSQDGFFKLGEVKIP
ncbi:MAG: DUF2079 domain-containing protein [Candidatus Omnitrophota bacterium]